jgi:hypothetical protein
VVPVKKNDRENEKILILRVFQDVLNEDPRAAPVAFAIFRLLTLRRGIAVVRQSPKLSMRLPECVAGCGRRR